MAGFYRIAGTAGGNRASNPRAGVQPVPASAPSGMALRARTLAQRFTNIKLWCQYPVVKYRVFHKTVTTEGEVIFGGAVEPASTHGT